MINSLDLMSKDEKEEKLRVLVSELSNITQDFIANVRSFFRLRKIFG